MLIYKCLLYILGIIPTTTYVDLSFKKDTQQMHTYALSNQNARSLYISSRAVDRNVSTCTRTNALGMNSPDKETWWIIDLGGNYSIYSVNIQFLNYDGYELRQRGRFAGFSLYVSDIDVSSSADIKRSRMCYKDGPQLPPLNFTTKCIEHGRYVIFYNERLNATNYPEGYEKESVFTELCEVEVRGCNKSGFFSINCDIPCPSNCKDGVCHIENGTCSVCKPGWTGTTCLKKCPDGFYGKNCTHKCVGHCRDGATCNHSTGHCDRGCDTGWTGPLCDKECHNGKYGFDCVNNCSGHCMNDSPCNKQTGHCDKKCAVGYMNKRCNESYTECQFGHFGKNCKELCSSHCVDSNEPCDHISGLCPNGCQDGYIGTFCKKTCEKGFFGRNCSFVCSPNCETCRNTDGFCSCKAGWMQPNCSTECVKSYGKNCQHHCSLQCVNQTCDRLNGSCTYGCRNGDMCVPEAVASDIDTLPKTLGGTIGACVVVILGVVVIVFIIRFKRKSRKLQKGVRDVLEEKLCFAMEITNGSSTPDNKFRDDHSSNEHESSKVPNEKTKRGLPTNKNIPARNIKAQIVNMTINDNAGFKSEYNDIPRGELYPCLEGKKQGNKVKNRYTTIFPYDHSRVVLRTVSSIEEGYFNANYIEDVHEKRIYIATQGPKPQTISDFWTMIWQEEICNIVCLTNLKEGPKNKCAQYWPDINDKLQGGTLTVRYEEKKTYAEYIIRRFKIHNKKTRTDRHVTMFHYTTWPDHGVADPLSLVLFHRHVIRATTNSAGKYTVVHCSAGVGRTGTYIALDALYREGERTGKINVPMFVRAMRKGRMNMIQGYEQYKLLYFALMEAFSGPSRCMTTEKFVGAYQEQTCYANCGDVLQNSSQSSEFEELLSLRKEYSQQDYTSGRAQISANYTQGVLPVEEYMCHLSYIKGHNTYYNAVLLQSYLEKDSLISAQYPLPDNTEDFLRLIKDFDARVVVFLCPLKDIESTPSWFPTDNQSKLNGLFFVKNISTTKASNVTMTKLNIQPQGFSEMSITVIECPTWREGKETADKRVLLDVIKAVKTEKSDQEGRFIVLSSDGATRCGPFCVVYNVLEQISVDKEVDIFTTTRQLQVRRPEFVSNLEEYQLCHDTVAEYLLNDCVYGNC